MLRLTNCHCHCWYDSLVSFSTWTIDREHRLFRWFLFYWIEILFFGTSILLYAFVVVVYYSRGINRSGKNSKRGREREKRVEQKKTKDLMKIDNNKNFFFPSFSNTNPIDTILYTNTTSTNHFSYHRHLSNDKYKKEEEKKATKKKKNTK